MSRASGERDLFVSETFRRQAFSEPCIWGVKLLASETFEEWNFWIVLLSNTVFIVIFRSNENNRSPANDALPMRHSLVERKAASPKKNPLPPQI